MAEQSASLGECFDQWLNALCNGIDLFGGLGILKRFLGFWYIRVIPQISSIFFRLPWLPLFFCKLRGIWLILYQIKCCGKGTFLIIWEFLLYQYSPTYRDIKLISFSFTNHKYGPGLKFIFKETHVVSVALTCSDFWFIICWMFLLAFYYIIEITNFYTIKIQGEFYMLKNIIWSKCRLPCSLTSLCCKLSLTFIFNFERVLTKCDLLH